MRKATRIDHGAPGPRRRRAAGTALAVVVSVAGCSDWTPDVSADPAGTSQPAPATWAATSTSGIPVTVSADAGPLRPGPIELTIRLDEPAEDGLPVTLDLVSPDMPMHGVVRYPTSPEGSGHYAASLEIPMEGYWEIYVNLDYGADAAVFPVEVELPEGAQPHEHGGGAGHEVMESPPQAIHPRRRRAPLSMPRGTTRTHRNRHFGSVPDDSLVGGDPMNNLLLALFALAFLALGAAPASAQMEMAEGEEVEFTAQVVDMSCKVVYDMSGDAHRECSQVCADRGVPLGLLSEDGTLYLPVSQAMPGASDNERLRPHAEHTVTVRGLAIERGGINTIIIESVEM